MAAGGHWRHYDRLEVLIQLIRGNNKTRSGLEYLMAFSGIELDEVDMAPSGIAT